MNKKIEKLLRNTWCLVYSDKVIKDVIESINTKDLYVYVPDFEFLECVRDLTSPNLQSYTGEKDWPGKAELKADIEKGVAFKFSILESKLYWER